MLAGRPAHGVAVGVVVAVPPMAVVAGMVMKLVADTEAPMVVMAVMGHSVVVVTEVTPVEDGRVVMGPLMVPVEVGVDHGIDIRRGHFMEEWAARVILRQSF